MRNNLFRDNIDELKKIIERLHKCKASYLDKITIMEKYGQKTVWQGIVHIFKISDHPQVDTCYAWSSPIEGSTKRRYYTVLKIPPIDSPEKAVRATIARDYKQNKFKV